jgi:2-polyprenyl-6-methoxyphenol hydroxylase-like FAD-dependent oxidoreductase
MHGVVLKRLGHDVCILEQNTQSLRGDLAAGITAHPQVEEFFRIHDHIQEPWSVYSPGIQFLAKSCAVKRYLNRPFQMTSWAVLYYRLRANYDSFASDFCPKSPPSTEHDGVVTYEVGKRATNLTLYGSTVTLYFDNLLTHEQGSLQADLVILADGASSSLRSIFFPSVQRTYAGYVAFRGTVPEADVSEEAKKIFDPHLSYFTFKNSYILLYAPPWTPPQLPIAIN